MTSTSGRATTWHSHSHGRGR